MKLYTVCERCHGVEFKYAGKIVDGEFMYKCVNCAYPIVRSTDTYINKDDRVNKEE